MSAARLREAAAEIRLEWSGDRGGAWHRTQAFHLAVADWLEVEAQAHIHLPGSDRPKSLYDQPIMANSPAMRVADAYLAGGAA